MSVEVQSYNDACSRHRNAPRAINYSDAPCIRNEMNEERNIIERDNKQTEEAENIL